MKNALKKIIVSLLGWQIRILQKRHQFKTVGVVGSIGKTSTKLAIAQVLGKSLRVRCQEGNYNDIVSVPLVYFGEQMPSLFNPFAWIAVLLRNQRQIFAPFPYDVVVLELGTDAPGQIAAFKKYVKLDIGVITAISPEHMEHFSDITSVAKEELSVAEYSTKLVYNADLVHADFVQGLSAGSITYALSDAAATYHMANIFHSAAGMEGDVKVQGEILLHVAHEVVSETQLYSMLAAVVVGRELELKNTQLLEGIAQIKPVSGRLRRLRGINNSTIIDDTYNASPVAVKAGLETLYKLQAPHKIAILGNMNELGSMSADAHREIGEFCDPKQLELVVTIGPDANSHLARAAQAKGCQVKTFDTPYAAGEYLQGVIQPETVVYAKGSQNKVFAEEAIKSLLADPEDAAKLVRQSDYWLTRKKQSFGEK